MKKILLLIFSLIPILSFGQTFLNTVKTNCIKYLERTLNDPKSYRPVSWTKLEKVNTSFDESEISKDLDIKIDFDKKFDYKLTSEMARLANLTVNDIKKDSTYNRYRKIKYDNLQSIDSLIAIKSANRKSFIPVFSHYYIEHSFRAKNQYNATVLKKYSFILNAKFKVIDSGDVEESEIKRDELMQEINQLTNQ